MTRALITGGAGFIGSHLVKRLLVEGGRVRVLDNFSSGRVANLAGLRDDIELLRGDVRDVSVVEKATRGIDAVFHLAAVASVSRSLEDPIGTHEVNVGGTLRVLECSRRSGVRRVVYASSASVYGDAVQLPHREEHATRPLSPYALQKLTGESYCRLYSELLGLSTVALRFFNVFGPRQDPEGEYASVIPRFLKAHLAGQPPRIFGDGEQTRDFVFVGDVVEANLRAVRAELAPGQALNVGSGRATNLNELERVIRDLTGSGQMPLHESPRPGDIRHSLADITRATAALGYEPKFTLEAGLAETLR